MWRTHVGRSRAPPKLGPHCLFESALSWLRSFGSPSGLAYAFSLIFFALQAAYLDAFLVTYIDASMLWTLAVEIPLLLHLAWFWREDSAHRSTPVAWLTYSWVHAAKVVVLFCRVMPRLPASTEETGPSLLGVSFGTLFTPTKLANLLLVTPVFYALLMFRASRAIFGRFTHKITVDFLMHYDMLWHVAIDMVDQVDMFHHARLAEWESVRDEQKPALVNIQTIIPPLLFFSMVLQAQAFPGVVVDEWRIPQHVDPPSDNGSSSEHSGSGRGLRSRTDLADSPEPPRVPPPPELPWRRPSPTSPHAGECVVEERPRAHSLSTPRPSWPRRSYAAGRPSTASTNQGREGALRLERDRRRRMQDIIQAVRRQNVIIARKRSAMVSIFATDVPFLTVRLVLWALLGHQYFPGLGVKNAICIVLNAMQATLVRFADRASFRDIVAQLAQYKVRFVSAAGGAAEAGQSPKLDGTEASIAGSNFSTPQEVPLQDSYGRPSSATPPTGRWQRRVGDAERVVRHETDRSAGVCTHCWSLLLAFVVGFLLAKGDWFIAASIKWIRDPRMGFG